MAVRSLKFVLSASDKNVGQTFDKVGKKADGLGKRMSGMAGGLAGGALAAGVVSFGKASVTAFKDAERSQAELQGAFDKFPKLADTSMAALQNLNGELAKKTKFDDDALGSGQAVLAQFNLTGKQIEGLTPLLADYAAKTGKDLPTAAQDLGKAVMGQGKALKGIGINLKDTGSATGNLAALQDALNAKVGGFAAREGKTAAGQAAILSNQFGELQEGLGSKLVPVLTTVTEKLLAFVGFVQKNSGWITPLAVGIGTIVAAMKAWTIAQAALNVVMTANPIGLVIVAIAGLVAGLVIAYKKSETFRSVVQTVFKAVGNAVLTMVDVWLGAWQKLFQAMSHIPVIGDKFKGVADGIGRARDKVHELRDGINGLKDKTVNIKVVTTEVAQRAANAGIRSGALSGSEAAASVRTRTARLTAAPAAPVIVVRNKVDKRGLTTAITSEQRQRIRRGQAPVFG